jgi:hypothetical protein
MTKAPKHKLRNPVNVPLLKGVLSGVRARLSGTNGLHGQDLVSAVQAKKPQTFISSDRRLLLENDNKDRILVSEDGRLRILFPSEKDASTRRILTLDQIILKSKGGEAS